MAASSLGKSPWLHPYMELDMELVAALCPASDCRLMATVTYVRTLDYVASILGEDVELLEALA